MHFYFLKAMRCFLIIVVDKSRVSWYVIFKRERWSLVYYLSCLQIREYIKPLFNFDFNKSILFSLPYTLVLLWTNNFIDFHFFLSFFFFCYLYFIEMRSICQSFNLLRTFNHQLTLTKLCKKREDVLKFIIRISRVMWKK